MMLFLDIGGTTTRIGAGDKDGAVTSVRFPTNQNVEEALKDIEREGTALLSSPCSLIIAGVAGAVKDGVVVHAPNLPGWDGIDLGTRLGDLFSCPWHVVNDAVLGGLGEAHAGAGKGAHILLYMTLGTGIGASRIVDGKPDFTVGSETGHQSLLVNGVLVEAEDIVSGKALKKKYGKPAEELRDPSVWDEVAHAFAPILRNTILHFAPDTVVMGGSLVKEGSLSVATVAKELALISDSLPSVPTIVHAALGDEAGLYGAQAYARLVL